MLRLGITCHPAIYEMSSLFRTSNITKILKFVGQHVVRGLDWGVIQVNWSYCYELLKFVCMHKTEFRLMTGNFLYI